ncbi:DUF3833 domain-containing protein [Aliishimia ponticola]|uniref:DUF3833 domain-containing protein n=1 Tax=Aliishimia ponticola TaxID=2499833 RepID=A0A4S4NBK0_9RHOB|nr:DUF3833 domain-containing protein [Aliishimia ponticola]THH36772.1 DUF3833 domain-containing protein [Aliishimia ponticola]
MDGVLFAALGGLIVILALRLIRRFVGFETQTPADYAEGKSGQFDLRKHLNGPLICEGVIYGPLGRVNSRFVAEFDCRWDGNIGVMDEVFRYDNGTEQTRAWHLRLGNDGRIVATAADVIGEGHGTQSGDSVQLLYQLRLPEDAGGHVLKVTDWMYLAPNGTIINRSQFRKFGIKVAELVAVMRPNQSLVEGRVA